MHWNHEMHDDTADWAVKNYGAFIPRGCDQQGRVTATADQRNGGRRVDTKQPMPAEACSEFLETQDDSADAMVLPVLMVAAIGFIALVAWVACYV